MKPSDISSVLLLDFTFNVLHGRHFLELLQNDTASNLTGGQMLNENNLYTGVPVDKIQVHKHNPKNVLICNLRRALPLLIEKKNLELDILPYCNDSEKAVILESYILSEEKTMGTNYCLNGFSPVISVDKIKNLFKSGSLTRSEFSYFLAFYKKNRKSCNYSLQNTPDAIELIKLLKIASSGEPGLPEKRKAELSDILDKTQHIQTGNLFYASMVVDINHPYFFEHPNEHVPGMMLVEAVRQALVASTHKYGNVPLKEYNFVLSSISADFKSYIELNLPVLFKIELTSVYTYDSGIWSDLEFIVRVYQLEKETAMLNFHGNIITSRVFKRMRLANDMINKKRWFILKKNIEYRAVIRGTGLKKVEIEIEYISYDQCIFLTAGLPDNPQIEKNKNLEFFMYFHKIGFVHGTCDVVSINTFGNSSQIHIKFCDMDPQDKNNLHETIKKYAYLLEG